MEDGRELSCVGFVGLFLMVCRLKDVAQKQYTQSEAMQGAGKGIEVYKPAHPKESSEMDDL